ncbi:Ankyrin repeat domain containing protein, partial [Asbolus verrucosus]
GATLDIIDESEGNTPLTKAIENVNEEIVNELLDNGADVNKPDFNALRKERFEMVKYFVEQGEDVNQMNDKKETPLSIAASNNDYRSFQLLIDYGADIGLATEKLEELASSDINLDTYIKSLNEENIIKKEQF